jgi:hypothetical protein
MPLIILSYPVLYHLPDGELIWPGVLPVFPDNSEPIAVQNEGHDPVTWPLSKPLSSHDPQPGAYLASRRRREDAGLPMVSRRLLKGFCVSFSL